MRSEELRNFLLSNSCFLIIFLSCLFAEAAYAYPPVIFRTIDIGNWKRLNSSDLIFLSEDIDDIEEADENEPVSSDEEGRSGNGNTELDDLEENSEIINVIIEGEGAEEIDEIEIEIEIETDESSSN